MKSTVGLTDARRRFLTSKRHLPRDQRGEQLDRRWMLRALFVLDSSLNLCAQSVQSAAALRSMTNPDIAARLIG